MTIDEEPALATTGPVLAPELPTPPAPADRDRPVGRAVRAGRSLLIRLGWLVIVAWAAVSVTFVLSRVIPADPARLAAGLQAGPEQVAAIRAELGLDQPLWKQYVDYLGGIVRLDLGDSIQTRQPVLDDVLRYLPSTLELVIVSFVIYVVLGIGLGVIWARRPRGLTAIAIRFVALAGVALPVFWIGLMLQLFFGSKLHWLPISGDPVEDTSIPRPTGSSLIDTLLNGNLPAFGTAVSHFVLPVATLVIGQLALAVRMTKVSLSQELRKPYVRTARARGVGDWRITIVDALRNALNPVVTILGVQFGWLLGGTILVEVIYSWPGLGLYAYNAFQTFDYNAILAVTLVVTIAFVVVNELVTLLYPVLDPKLRERR